DDVLDVVWSVEVDETVLIDELLSPVPIERHTRLEAPEEVRVPHVENEQVYIEFMGDVIQTFECLLSHFIRIAVARVPSAEDVREVAPRVDANMRAIALFGIVHARIGGRPHDEFRAAAHAHA